MAKIQKNLRTCQKKVVSFIEKVIEPHPNITDVEDRYRSRLLNSLLVIYLPIAILVILFRFIVLPDDVTTTIAITSLATAVVVVIYIVGRTGFYRSSVYVTVTLGYSVIYLNAVNSSSPHFEIAYLTFIPLLGIVLFSMREALLNYVIAIGLLILFLATAGDIEKGIAVDLFVFMILVQGFIFFANYQRNRLDINRQELAIEKKRSELIKQLIDNVSHDFKTPLSIIQTSLYLIRRVDTPDRREQGLVRIENQALRLESMIQDLLTVSKLDQGIMLQLKDVDLWELIGIAQQQLSPLATAKHIIIEQHIDTDNCQIAGILDELERMILNLIGNAINYTPEGGRITIRLVSSREGYLCLEVADTGIGISEDDMAHIFERFYRVDKARSTHTGGTGLGLPIVKQIVERHHGDIRVDSQVGVGTTFSILLPVSSDS